MNYDVIVLGLGAFGSATLYQLAQQKPSINFKFLGIDQYSPMHPFGSSHGESRITRTAIGEYPEYTETALRSQKIWQEIEYKTKKEFGDLYEPTGGLIIGPEQLGNSLYQMETDFLQQTMAAAKNFDIEHWIFTTENLQKRFPQFKISVGDFAYYEKSMGYLRPESCIAAQLALAQTQGAEIHTQETVLSIRLDENNQPIILTNKNCYRTKKLVITAGAWLPTLLPDYKKFFKIYRQILFWFQVAATAQEKFKQGNCPVFARIFANGDVVYGFPMINSSNAIKLGFDDPSVYESETQADLVMREVTPEEIDKFYQKYVAPYFSGLTNRCIQTAVCLYTSTISRRFLVEYMPDSHENIIITSACSGHGFKHSAAIGEAVAQLIISGSNNIEIMDMFNRKYL